nr:hypothetical protein GCM10020063_005130 [Dactylosporangium thailandense]
MRRPGPHRGGRRAADRRTAAGVQALVRTDEAALLDADALIEPPTLEEIAVHIGAPAQRSLA